MSIRELYRHFFEPETRPDSSGIAEARQLAGDLVRASEGAYLPFLMKWLDSQASIPVPVGEHFEMVSSAARAGAFRDMHSRIARDIERARKLLEPHDG